MALLLVEAALDLLAKGGRGDFSLRAVAEAIGAAGSAASHRFGDHAGLVSATCKAAIAYERRDIENFVSGLPVVPAGAPLAEILLAWLEHRVRWDRRQTRACCELLLMSYREPAAAGFGREWLGCWEALLERLCADLTPRARRLIACYLMADTPNWLLSADDTLFRVANGESLHRAVALAVGARSEPLPVFWLQQTLLREGGALPPTPAHAGTKQRIVEAIATIVLDGGVEAVTHREIAKRAVVSLSSLTHHFGSRTELVRAGMHYLLMRSDSDPRSVILPYELALQALSDPFLAPLASAVRLQMGASAHAAQNYVDGITGRARAEMTALTDCAAALVGEADQA